MSREYISASYSQLLPRCSQVWALYYPLLVFPHSAMWDILFLFLEEETDLVKDIESTELRNRGIRILTQKGPHPQSSWIVLTAVCHLFQKQKPSRCRSLLPLQPTSHLHKVFCSFAVAHSPWMTFLSLLLPARLLAFCTQLLSGVVRLSRDPQLPLLFASIYLFAHYFDFSVGLDHASTNNQRTMMSPSWELTLQSCPQRSRAGLGIVNSLGALHTPQRRKIISHRPRLPVTFCLEPPRLLCSAERLNQGHIVATHCP